MFDEVFGHLDASGEGSVAQLLAELSTESAVYAISHTSELVSYADRKIEVEKVGGVSRVTGDLVRATQDAQGLALAGESVLF